MIGAFILASLILSLGWWVSGPLAWLVAVAFIVACFGGHAYMLGWAVLLAGVFYVCWLAYHWFVLGD